MTSLARILLSCLALTSALWGAPEATSESLIIQNRPVHTFRAPLGPLGPRERVERARARLAAVPDARLREPVQALGIPEGVQLLIGDQPLFTVLQGDLEPGVDGTAVQAAERVRMALAEALVAESEQRDVRRLAWSAGAAGLATLGFALTVYLLRRIRRWVQLRLTQLEHKAVPRLALGNLVLFDGFRLSRAVQLLLRLFHVSLLLLLIYLWATYVLGRFPYTQPWARTMTGYLMQVLAGLLQKVVSGIPGFLAVTFIALGTRLLVRAAGSFFNSVERGDVELNWLHAETAQPTRRIVTAVLWASAAVMAYPYLPGSDSLAFKGVSVFMGLLISLGSSGVMNQAMSGLVLMYSRAFKVGDAVRIGDAEGIVAELGLLSTKLRVRRQEEVTIPNAVVLGANIKNYSRPGGEEGQVLHTSVTIGYDAPWRQVQALLLLAAGRTEGLRKEPAPFVLQTALSDYYVEYQLNVRLANPEQRFLVRSELHGHIQDAFNEFGVQIMSPHYIGDKAAPVVVPRDQWFAAPASPETKRP